MDAWAGKTAVEVDDEELLSVLVAELVDGTDEDDEEDGKGEGEVPRRQETSVPFVT